MQDLGNMQVDAVMLIERLNALFAKKRKLWLEVGQVAPADSDEKYLKASRKLQAAEQEFNLCWQCLADAGYYPCASGTGGFRLSSTGGPALP